MAHGFLCKTALIFCRPVPISPSEAFPRGGIRDMHGMTDGNAGL